MTTTSVKKAVVLLASVSLLVASCTTPQGPAPGPTPAAAPRAEFAGAPGCAPVTLTIDANSITPPKDIPGGAGSASLQSAAVFAWQEFIALNWPAVTQNGQLNTRDQPDPQAIFGDPKYSGAQPAGPLVWHTFRHKVEIYPGSGNPHGYVNDATKFYGYDDPPQYVYAGGPIPPFGPASQSTPWINLDEESEIGLDTMYAGNAPTEPFPGQQILFLAKASRAQYAYVAANGWWNDSRKPAIDRTIAYFQSVAKNPQQYVEYPPGSTTEPAAPDARVSFPNNTIEVKSGWRQLTQPEIDSKRFYMAPVRYYNRNGSGPIGYVDAVWGMVALHIIQKTPSAPYFIYATFSQADNLLDSSGKPVEDENGKLLPNVNPSADPFNPNITSRNATGQPSPSPQSSNAAPAASPTPYPNPDTVQKLSPPSSSAQPGKSIYFSNTADTPTTQGLVAVNRRAHNIPQCIIDVNTAAHAAIAAYSQQNNVANSVWQYYKLVNVQYQPFDKPAGETYTKAAAGGPDPATYYLANEMVETDYNLQFFSGQFQGTLPAPYSQVNVADLITDYNDDGTPFRNTYYSTQGSGKAANMGGCMGCHANAQSLKGSDFSFIFKGGPVAAPEVASGPTTPSPVRIEKFRRLLMR